MFPYKKLFSILRPSFFQPCRRKINCCSHNQKPCRQRALKFSCSRGSKKGNCKNQSSPAFSSASSLHSQKKFDDRNRSQYSYTAESRISFRLSGKYRSIIPHSPLIQAEYNIPVKPQEHSRGCQSGSRGLPAELSACPSKQNNPDTAAGIQPSFVERHMKHRQKRIPPQNHKYAHHSCLQKKQRENSPILTDFLRPCPVYFYS